MCPNREIFFLMQFLNPEKEIFILLYVTPQALSPTESSFMLVLWARVPLSL